MQESIKDPVLNLVVFLWFCQSFYFFYDIDTFGEFRPIVENVYSLDLSHCFHLRQEQYICDDVSFSALK